MPLRPHPFLVLAAWLGGCIAPAAPVPAFSPLPRPAYPLYTISSVKGDVTEDDVRLLAENFTLLHGKMTRETFDRIRALNPDFKCLHYINSTYTRVAAHVGVVESSYRTALCMHLAARLQEAVAADAAELRIAAPAGADAPVAVRASTVDGEVSSTDPAQPSTRFYVFWIRIGDELMRVDAFDPASGRLKVTRGFSGTAPAAHAAGNAVLSPVYLGFKRDHKDKYPGQHPGGPGKHLRYVLDPGVSSGYPFIADQVVQEMKEEGTDGVWLDTLNTGDFNLSDALGRPVRPWNTATGREYTYDEFRLGQERKIAFVQEYVRKAVGRYPYLVANNLKPTTYYSGHGGMRFLLMPTADKPRPLDGFCMEGGLSWEKTDLEPENLGWKERIMLLMDAAQSGLAALPILGGAGSESVASEPDTPERDRAERFGYASYLLAVEKHGKTRMGTYAFYQKNGRRFVKVHPMYYFPIGTPAESFAPGALDRYKIPGSHAYQRHFTGGLVVVNPSDADCSLHLERTYLDPDSGQPVTRLVVPPGHGKILLLQQSANRM